MTRLFRRVALVGVLVGLFSLSSDSMLLAQAGLGSVDGRVVDDATGDPLPGALVKVAGLVVLKVS